MTIESPNNMPYIPNSGCSTFEVNQKMMDDTYAALKKIDKTVDKFIKTDEGKAKKESLQKKLKLAFGAVAAGALAVGLVRSGSINKMIDAIKDSKLVNEIKDIFSKKMTEIKYVGGGAEKISIPTGSKYDLANECLGIRIITNNQANGQTWSTINESLLGDVPETFCNGHANVGITKNGRAYVKASSENLSFIGNNTNFKFKGTTEALSGITLFSNDRHFTPAQKNLIALMNQDLAQSPNSIFAGKNRIFVSQEAGETIEDLTSEGLFQKIAQWAQDIDPENHETQTLLNQLSKLKPGEGVAKVRGLMQAPIEVLREQK